MVLVLLKPRMSSQQPDNRPVGRFEKQGLRAITIKEILGLVVIQGSHSIWKEGELLEIHSDKTMTSRRDGTEWA